MNTFVQFEVLQKDQESYKLASVGAMAVSYFEGSKEHEDHTLIVMSGLSFLVKGPYKEVRDMLNGTLSQSSGVIAGAMVEEMKELLNEDGE